MSHKEPDYFKKYLEQAKEHKFSPTSAQEIIRYLMVCGHIPVTEEHLTLMGDKEFNISAAHVPEYAKAAEIHYLKHPYDGEYKEEVELEHIKTHGHEIESMHFKGGEMTTFKVTVTRTIKVETTLDYHAPAWGDPDYRINEECPKCGSKRLFLMKDLEEDGEGFRCAMCGEEFEQMVPWTNRICSECKYYEDCPFEGIPQPHCDEPRMKKDAPAQLE